jgi:hypothetical protein
MFQSHCLLNIGATAVHGAWLPGLGGGRPARAVAPLEDAFAGESGGISGALSSVLGQILPRRAVMAPYVRVGLASSHMQAAIMTFAKLPKSGKDRALLISQRFCRDFRFDPDSVTVLGSRLGSSKAGGEAVLCVALPAAVLAEIEAPLNESGLYASEISPDYMLRFAGTDTRKLEAPGIALMQLSGGGTILVWDKERTIVHVSSYTVGQNQEDGERRMVSRIVRYAATVGADGASVAVYVDSQVLDMLAELSAARLHSVKLLRWPEGHGPWSQEIAAL